MKMFYKGKDGGKDSTVTGYWLIEIKSLFSICLLRFDKGTRENFHSHAFNALTWFTKGDLVEERLDGNLRAYKKYKRSFIPKVTRRDNIHRVCALKTSWCFSIRGRWEDIWKEYNETTCKYITLTHGRKVLKESYYES